MIKEGPRFYYTLYYYDIEQRKMITQFALRDDAQNNYRFVPHGNYIYKIEQSTYSERPFSPNVFVIDAARPGNTPVGLYLY